MSFRLRLSASLLWHFGQKLVSIVISSERSESRNLDKILIIKDFSTPLEMTEWVALLQPGRDFAKAKSERRKGQGVRGPCPRNKKGVSWRTP